MTEDIQITQPWDHLAQLIEEKNQDALRDFWRTLSSSELVRAVSRMEPEDQENLLTLLDPDDAADLLDELPHIQAAEILDDLPVEQAAAIVDELESDEQVDVLSELDKEDAEAILQKMDPVEAQDVRRLWKYEPDTAGGIMATEYLSYPADATVTDVLADLREHVEQYAEYDVRYIYVVTDTANPRFCGGVRLKDLVLSPGQTPLMSILDDSILTAVVTDDLDHLEDLFDRQSFSATPVVDEQGCLVGVVKRSSVEEALGERSEKTRMRFSGIVTGEELRTMPAAMRSVRRLAFLLPTMVMSAVAVSIIGAHQATIKHVTTLAMFLPLVASLSGSSGNQAVAVSIRELSLGVSKPADLIRVLLKESLVGIGLGTVLGLLIFGLAWMWTGQFAVAVAVGGALPFTVLIAVLIGGAMPLILGGLKLDPAMMSSPITTTTTDFLSFFIVLWLATHLMGIG